MALVEQLAEYKGNKRGDFADALLARNLLHFAAEWGAKLRLNDPFAAGFIRAYSLESIRATMNQPDKTCPTNLLN